MSETTEQKFKAECYICGYEMTMVRGQVKCPGCYQGFLDAGKTEREAAEKIQGLSAQLAAAEEKVRLADDREAAVFAKGYRSGFFDGSGGTTAFNDEVGAAYARWADKGKKTHLDDPDAAALRGE